ncbi:uncharacterized protein LOC122089328 [Macadamia integrifolia]|uniref:uncharacterized protein LOC122089328 n=1 Tax=Macadamia integrifolia TaxID=60698 RepID=UPI001C4E7C34|nr:uncharacterized protein LOC122089328 [Macadamia integrifolia]
MFSISFMKKAQTTTPFISRPIEPYHLKPRNNTLLQVAPASFYFLPTLSTQNLRQRSFVTKSTTGSSLVRCGRDNLASGEDDHRALETVLKLYKAIKNRNLRELSDVIGDECRCVCNFVSFLHLFHGKEQVLEFFSFLLGSLGKNVEIIVKPTVHDGLTVGVQWKLEWKTIQIPLGKGISFHTMHVYQGKVLIKSIEMFMEPLLNIEPFRLKLMGFVMSFLDIIGPNAIIKGKERKLLYITLGSLVIFALLALFRRPCF